MEIKIMPLSLPSHTNIILSNEFPVDCSSSAKIRMCKDPNLCLCGIMSCRAYTRTHTQIMC